MRLKYHFHLSNCHLIIESEESVALLILSDISFPCILTRLCFFPFCHHPKAVCVYSACQNHTLKFSCFHYYPLSSSLPLGSLISLAYDGRKKNKRRFLLRYDLKIFFHILFYIVLKSPAYSYVYLVLSGPHSYLLGMESCFTQPGIISRNGANPGNEPVSQAFPSWPLQLRW